MMMIFQNLFSGSATKGFNYAFESVLVIILMLSIIIGFMNFNYNTNNSYSLNYLKVNDAFIILSNENTSDLDQLNKIMSFMFPNEDIELHVDDVKVFGTIPEGNCLIRDEDILVKESDVIVKKNFKIKFY